MALPPESLNKLKHVIVAGGSGYIGESVVSRLRAMGCPVTVIGRTPSSAGIDSDVRDLSWSLEKALPDELFAATKDLPPADTVIYLSHDWNTAGDVDEDPNLRAFRRLLSAVRLQGGIRMVLASTVSARAEALNRYGQIKWRMEEMLDGPEECAVRIGLVYGGEASGQWAMIRRISGFRILPMLDPWVRVQPVHIEDLASGLVRVATLKYLPGRILGFASPIAISFGRFLTLAGRMVHRRNLLVLPVPSFLLLRIIAILARFPSIPVPDRERIFGLVGLPVIETRRDLDSLAMTLRPLALGLATDVSEWRRAALREAYVHLSYVNGSPASIGELRTYVGLLACGSQYYDTALPIRYAGVFLRFPWMVRLIDPPAGNSRLRQRLMLAFQIAERRGALGQKVFQYNEEAAAMGWMRVALVGVVETLLVPTRLLALLLAPK